jgi:hypothetical protein
MVNLLAGVGLRRGLEGPASGPLSTSASSYSSAGSPRDGVVGVCISIVLIYQSEISDCRASITAVLYALRAPDFIQSAT